jgi:putative Holliday junction resolvase
MFAHPQPALVMGPERAAAEVARLAREHDVCEVIVGLPLTLGGGDSAQTREARTFAATVRGLLDVPVREWDERLSSVEAATRLRGQRDRRDGTRDSVAAAIVLQSVLDRRRSAQT